MLRTNHERLLVQTRAANAMTQHYVAYHSTNVMGREYVPGRKFSFLSSKSETLLRGALSGTTWVIVGTRIGRATRYVLAGRYRASSLKHNGSSWVISGPGVPFVPAIDVTSLPWFVELRKEQANFSIGFNSVRSAKVVAELEALLSPQVDENVVNGRARVATLPEEVVGLHDEGQVERISINRYERDPRARDECLRVRGDSCLVCEVDLGKVYGPIAAGLVHVHHLRPLSALRSTYKVNPATDLIPVCPNCHAVIHRKTPPLSPKEVRDMLQKASRRSASRGRT